MKKQLFIMIALLGMSMGLNAQTKFAAGSVSNSYFICSDGFPKATGANLNGQLGDGTNNNTNTPIPVGSLSGIIEASGGTNHSLFLKNDGTVWASGENGNGQLGNGTTPPRRNTPAQISGLSDIIAIAAGKKHSLFLKNDGTVWDCGWNDKGQLGDGTTVDKYFPFQISGLSGITAISAGEKHSLFLKNDSTVWACGWNQFGQLGDGTNNDRHSPVQVSGLSSIIAISAGTNHSLFLKNDGTVWDCGWNDKGQLGDGTTINKFSPIQVNGLSGITAIAGGQRFSLFLKNDGTVWACGWNFLGALGDGTSTESHTPIKSQISCVIDIAAGAGHALYLKDDNTIWACGENYQGTLGDGTNTKRRTPVQVLFNAQCRTDSITLTTPTVMCEGGATQSLTGTPTGGSWSSSKTSVAKIDSSGKVTSVGNGTATITYTLIRCADTVAVTATVKITVNPKTKPTFSQVAAICKGDSLSALPTKSKNAITGSWSPSIDTAQTTTYTFTPDTGQCADTTTMTITVNPLPTPTISGSSNYCVGDSANLDAGNGYSNYTWSTGDNTQKTSVTEADNPITVTVTDGNGCVGTSMPFRVKENSIITTNTSHSICQGETYTLPGGTKVSTSGTYTDTLTSTSGCDSIITTNLTVNPITSGTDSATICQGDSILLGGVYQSVAGNYTDTLTAVNGCDSIITTNLTIYPSPIASFTLQPQGGTIITKILYKDNSQGAIQWLWEFGDGDSSSTRNAEHNYKKTGQYGVVLMVTNQFGCSDTATRQINIRENLFIPNVFSPNDDGVNDKFIVKGAGMKEYSLKIYNRWGKLIYSSEKLGESWDGTTTDGQEASAGNYYYTVIAKTRAGKDYSRTGYLTLFR